MMRATADTPDHWAVSARASGELLAAEALAPGLEVRLLGVPEDFTREEVEGWLRDVMQVTRERAAQDDTPRPIPALLHHALNGLLFSHAAVWNPGGAQAPCSVALTWGAGQVGVGWVGGAEVEVFLDHEPIDVPWTVVRDEAGGEARAWCVDAERRVDLRVSWSRLREDASEPAVSLEATWPGVERPVPRPGAETEPQAAPRFDRPEPTTSPAAAEPASSESPASGSETVRMARPSWGVSRWLERYLGRRGPRREAVPSAGAEAQVAESQPAPISVAETSSVEPASLESAPLEPASLELASLEPALLEPASLELASLELASLEPASLEPALLEPASLEPGAVGERFSLEAAAGEEPEPPVRSLKWPVGMPVEELVPPAEAPEPILPAEVPDLIPPAPEHPLLTAQTVGASEPFDPRAIQLPRETPPLELVPGLVPPVGTPTARTAGVEPGEVDLETRVVLPGPNAGPEPAAGGAEPVRTHGADVTYEQPAMPPRAAIRRPAWPSAEQLEQPRRLAWWKWGGLAALVMLLFGGGWLLGLIQSAPPGSRRTNPVVATLRGLGLVSPRFEVSVSSRPPGASISVDGKDLGLRTPAAVELRPGEHLVSLSFAGLGSANRPVRVERGPVALDVRLWGSLEVISPDPGASIMVAVDDQARGFAPLRVDSLAPGPHEVRFWGQGMASWGQTVEIRVNEEQQLFTRPLRSPATGLLQIRAVLNENGESRPLTGVRVWVDGQPRGAVPLGLELARGPHSVRVVYRDEEAPVQVIDLPGGNQRFANFEFGLADEHPRLVLSAPHRIPEQPVVVSATLQNAPAGEPREMWLHVRTPEGRWRRYPMALLQSEASGTVGAIAFPSLLLGPQGQTSYYVSALTGQGDEYFTELQTVRAESPQRSR